jgi:Protein of unknown function (DUF1064)
VVTVTEYKALAKPKKPTKYRAIRTQLDGITFASKKESYRYTTLKLLQQRGAVTDLELQPKFDLLVNGVKVASYIADFRYKDATGATITEDVKSPATATPVYRLKKRLMWACHRIEIKEV